MKKQVTFFLLPLICIFIFSSCVGIGMDHLPEGELMESVQSPDGTYKINSFLVSGNATVAFCVRCEVVEIASGEKRNIYWEYRCETAVIEWVDETTVEINGKQLNVLTDSYDWRNN